MPLNVFKKRDPVLADGRIYFNRMYSDSVMPSYAHTGDAGLDLCSVADIVIEPGDTADVGTGMRAVIPEGTAGLVCPRSGLAFNHGVTVLNAPGIVDSGYRGEIRVCLVNLGGHAHHVKRGDRIAQLVIVPVITCEVYETHDVDSGTGRGNGGFGSTGR